MIQVVQPVFGRGDYRTYARRLTSSTTNHSPTPLVKTSLSFFDDVDHQRFKQVAVTGATTTTTRYADAFGALSEAIVYSSGTWQVNDYLMVGGSMVGMRVIRSDGSTSVRYFHQDHLGSIAVITNESGALAEPRDAYDAWGKRRNFNGTDDVAGTLTSQTIRGLTSEAPALARERGAFRPAMVTSHKRR